MDDIQALRLAAATFVRHGDFAAAAPLLHRAAEVDPDCRVDAALASLGAGDYRTGFALYAHRPVKRPGGDLPEWKGEDLRGRRLLLFKEQGFGDQVMFARFAPLLQVMGAQVTLTCDPALARLFAGLGVEVVPTPGPGRAIDVDAWSMLMDVPGKLQFGVSDIPSAPYLRVEPIGRGGVGLVRSGNATSGNAADRFMPPEVVIPFATVSLDPRDTGAVDFFDTARIIAGLDAVVTIDSAVAHVAGALGKRTLLLLPAHGADWRWLERRTDSPWYPSMTIYRQSAPGNWDEVLRRAAHDLGSLAR
jgi:hypothetical protein